MLTYRIMPTSVPAEPAQVRQRMSNVENIYLLWLRVVEVEDFAGVGLNKPFTALHSISLAATMRRGLSLKTLCITQVAICRSSRHHTPEPASPMALATLSQSLPVAGSVGAEGLSVVALPPVP